MFRKVPLGWELPTADQPLIREIASKVPRVYNIAFVEISLEGVGWMGTPPCLCKPLSRWDGEETQFRTSRIELKKDFDYGNRYNPLRFVFDVTNETSLGEPLDVSGWAPGYYRPFRRDCGRPARVYSGYRGKPAMAPDGRGRG